MQLIQLDIVGFQYTVKPKQGHLCFEGLIGNRRLPIIIGSFEAAIAVPESEIKPNALLHTIYSLLCKRI